MRIGQFPVQAPFGMQEHSFARSNKRLAESASSFKFAISRSCTVLLLAMLLSASNAGIGARNSAGLFLRKWVSLNSAWLLSALIIHSLPISRTRLISDSSRVV